ncbi:MAG: hypothetical protein JSW60_05590 [Thermoplasmatales archaeon]|nr:MAG: hypothetical protein JSW60_05590 [Thermoplasmatales archaeon]
MIYRNWRLPKSKIHNIKSKDKSSKKDSKNKDEMKSALKDEEDLKRKKKRLNIDWFFRPRED